MHIMQYLSSVDVHKQFLTLLFSSAIVCTFKLQCPSPSHWKIRAKTVCGAHCPALYSCLFDVNNKTYVEHCTNDHDFVRPGRKYVIIGYLSDIECSIERYQPMKFWSNVSSQCAYIQSKCNGIGQTIYKIISTRQDVYCTCDFSSGYAFISKPNNKVYCIPSEEDCSCYLNVCQESYYMLSNYECVPQGNTSVVTKYREEMNISIEQVLDNLITDDIRGFFPHHLILCIPIIIVILFSGSVCFFLLKILYCTTTKQVEHNVMTNRPSEGTGRENSFRQKVIDYADKDECTPILTDCSDNHPETGSILFYCLENQDNKGVYEDQISKIKNTTDMLEENNQIDLHPQDELSSAKDIYHKNSARCSKAKFSCLQAIDHADKDGLTPFMTACLEEHLDSATDLLYRGADINKFNAVGQTALWLACYQGKTHVVQFLIRNNCDINKKDNRFWTPLKAAACSGKTEICKILISKGALIDEPDNEGFTPLMSATSQKNTEMVKLLNECCADIKKVNSKGKTALHLASINDNQDIVKELLKNGSDPNKEDYEFWTPVKEACYYGQTAILELLVSVGGDTNKVDKNGWSPLMAACRYGHSATVNSLIMHGANIRLKNKKGKSAFWMACVGSNKSILEALCKKGIDIDETDDRGRTPLRAASFVGHKDICQYLILEGANIEIPDKDGMTPLLTACSKGHKEVVDLLLKSGANPSICNKKEQNAFWHASNKGYSDINELLLKHYNF